MKLKDLNALVTGGSQGLGKTIAEHFLREGANVVLCARSGKDLTSARDALAAKFPERKISARICDVSNESQVSELIVFALRELGSLEALVLNAGVYGPMGPTESVSLDDWRRALDINLFGVLLPCRAVIPHFKKVGRGKIIVLSGGGATNPLPNISAYAASKAAVIGLTRVSAMELGEHGIRVNCICPGYVLTEMGAATRTPEMVATWSAMSPLGRCAEPDDVADMAVFLASDEAKYCTGEAMNVSGGMVMH